MTRCSACTFEAMCRAADTPGDCVWCNSTSAAGATGATATEASHRGAAGRCVPKACSCGLPAKPVPSPVTSFRAPYADGETRVDIFGDMGIYDWNNMEWLMKDTQGPDAASTSADLIVHMGDHAYVITCPPPQSGANNRDLRRVLHPSTLRSRLRSTSRINNDQMKPRLYVWHDSFPRATGTTKAWTPSAEPMDT